MITNSRKKNLSETELHFNGQATETFLSCFCLFLLIKDFLKKCSHIKKPVATYEVPPGHKQCFFRKLFKTNPQLQFLTGCEIGTRSDECCCYARGGAIISLLIHHRTFYGAWFWRTTHMQQYVLWRGVLIRTLRKVLRSANQITYWGSLLHQ